MARSPGCIDHTVVAMQVSGAGDDAAVRQGIPIPGTAG